MKVGEILANSIIEVSKNSTWSDGVKSYCEVESMSHDDLLAYVCKIQHDYVELGSKVAEIRQYIEFCQKHKDVK